MDVSSKILGLKLDNDDLIAMGNGEIVVRLHFADFGVGVVDSDTGRSAVASVGKNGKALGATKTGRVGLT